MNSERTLFCLKALLAVQLLTFTAPAQVIISEFMASNTRTLADEDGEYSDWIEVFNLGKTNVNLSNWVLTDDPQDLRKWRFPATEIKPGEALIVFASNKDRRTAGSPLHTNFRLSAGGDYLGLVNAGGQTVFNFGAQYPEQVPDVSYGVVGAEERVVLLSTNAPLRYFVPPNDSLGAGWQLHEFSDASWPQGTNSIGFDSPVEPLENAWTTAALATAPALFYPFEERSGTIVTNLGSLGAAYNSFHTNGAMINQTSIRPPDAPGMTATNVTPRFDGINDYTDSRQSLLNNFAAFSMSAWIRPTMVNRARMGLWGQYDAIEFGFIDAGLLQLSTASGGTVQAPYAFPANQWHHVAVTGDGQIIRIYIDGVLAAEGGNPTENYGASLYNFVIGGGGIFDPSAQNWFIGNIDEFLLHTRALSGDEIYNLYQAAKNPAASYLGLLNTEVSAAMKNSNSSIYLRHEVVTSNTFEGLLFNASYDDGFVAYLNGIEIARANAPEEPDWNSTATADRPQSSGAPSIEFDLSASADALQLGTNILSVQGLNRAADDGDFFFRSELIALSRRIDTNSVRYFTVSTPGRVNGEGEANAGPMIINVTHSPNQPEDDEAITVTARMVRTFHAPAELTLTYRVMFGLEVPIPMLDNGQNNDGAAGDGVYGAIIPAAAAKQGEMVRWYLRSRDVEGNTTRWPAYKDTRNSPQFLGTVVKDPRHTNNLPVIQTFVQNQGGADSVGGTRASVFWNGNFYDNIFINLHGQSSQGFPKKSYNLDFNTGYHFLCKEGESPVEDINLLTTWPDKAHVRNILAYETYRDAGHAYHWVLPVRVDRNGAFWGDAHMVEDGDEEFLARVGLDPKGALYKMYNTLDSATSGAEKKSRKFENHTDLQSLLAGLNRGGAAKLAYIWDNVNIPAMVNYLAAMIITGNVDCCHKNYYIYRDSEGTGEWQFLPWDLDLSFGRNWTSSLHYQDDNMYYNNGLNIGSNNRLPQELFAIPAFRQMYARRIRTLMDDLFQTTNTPYADLKYERRMRELYEQIAPDAALDFAKWPTWGQRQTMEQALNIMTNVNNGYMTRRRNYLYSTLRNQIAPAINEEITLAFGDLEVNPASGLQTQEYFSLVNTSRHVVDISGWTVEGAVEHTFAPGTVLPTNNGTIFLSPNVVAFRQRTASPKGGEQRFIQGNYRGQLSARGETIVLKDNTGRLVNLLTYEGQPTPGQQFLRVTEIMYAPGPNNAGQMPEETEYLALKNIGSEPLQLRGAHLTNGINFVFHSDLTLAPGKMVYVVKNPTAFRAVYGDHHVIAGPYTGQLSNEGETVELYDSVGEKILDFGYDNDWYPLTENQGFSLVIRDELAHYNTWSTQQSWNISANIGGSAANNDEGWTNFLNAHFTEAERNNPAISGATADPDGDGLTNNSEYIAGTNPREASSVFAVSEASLIGNALQLEISAIAGRSYSIWSSSDIGSGAWVRETQDTVASQTGALTLQVTPPAGGSKYYRVRTEL